MLNLAIASFSLGVDQGTNDDAIGHIVYEDGLARMAIADGVGSASHGGAAARLAISTCMSSGAVLSIENLFNEVALRIRDNAAEESGQWSTTLSVCQVQGSTAKIGHVGDTRIYHLRGKGLQSRTRDQTEIERLIEDGVISRERALRYPRKHVLLSAMNPNGDYDLQQSEFFLQHGDRVLLMSDGFYKQASKKEISSLSARHQNVVAFVEALKTIVLREGLVDDATVLCAEIAFHD